MRDFETRFDLGEAPPVPVERIATSLLDLLIEEHDDLRMLSGAPTDQGRLSGMIDPANATIWLDRHEAQAYPGRRRFTIAHEIGHWQLHVEAGDTPLFDRAEDISEHDGREPVEVVPKLRKREAEANAFAGELLMPDLLVREHARVTGCNLSALAERFGVSVPAIRLRLLTLDLLPAWMRATR
jgi:predicted transcriptional regulator